MKFRSLILFLIGYLLIGCYKEVSVFDIPADHNYKLPILLDFNGKTCGFDSKEYALRYPIQDTLTPFMPFVEFQEISEVWFDELPLENGRVNNLGIVSPSKSHTITIKTKEITQIFSLNFTTLPIVRLITPNKIHDEPKTLARLELIDPSENSPLFTSYIGIEIRGGSSRKYPKKAYGFSLLNSQFIDDEIAYALFDMNKNHQWILDAMYIDPARMRNKVSFEIWNAMTPSKPRTGIAGQFVELYLNNKHQGIYSFNELVNATHLDLDEKGLLYKAVDWGNGATNFEIYTEKSSTNNYWDGWEQKHPKDNVNWIPLKELRNLVVNGTNEQFQLNITEHIEIENFIDYYILLNLTLSVDNTGKNTFLKRQNNQSLFNILPWDLDASWGLFWDGTKIGHEGILSNNLYDRLFETNPNHFTQKLKNRWQELRADQFREARLLLHFKDNFKQINSANVQQIEQTLHASSLNLLEEQAFIDQWLRNRLIYLDQYYEGL